MGQWEVRMQMMEQLAEQASRGVWTADALREWAHVGLGTDQVLVLSNSEPYGHDLAPGGRTVLRHSTSGLVTALEPLMLATSGVWLAHGAATGDHLTIECDHGLEVPPYAPRYRLRRMWLTNNEVARYYDGFANGGLWPLCHHAHVRPVFRGDDFKVYAEINARFVDALCREVRGAAPIVLVHDYHLALAPRLVADRLPDSTIVAFWHIPWPAWQTFQICPWTRELLEGILGADIFGVQTPADRDNVIDTAEQMLKASVCRENHTVTYRGRRTQVRVYPASIEWPSRWAVQAPSVPSCREQVRRALRLAPETRLSVSVGRLDYTKGIDETFAAVERLLETYPEHRGTFTHVQLAAPSRTRVAAYRELTERVIETASRVNRRFGHGTYRPLHLLRVHHEPAEVFRYLRAAEVCYVGSLHDGMNLVAKEFVAARDDERGALMLSTFAGAARQLTDALLVNPYDLDDVAATLARALAMSAEEQRARMSRLRAGIAEESAYTWAARVLADVFRLRSGAAADFEQVSRSAS